MGKSESSLERLFILDPTCINEYGHNYLSGKSFASAIASSLKIAIFFCASRLFREARMTSGSDSTSIVHFFHHYYLREMPIAVDSRLDGCHSNLLDCSYEEYLLRRQEIAVRDLERLIDSFCVSEADILFYPNIDYVSLSALVRVLVTRGISGFPRIAIRFIGVLEYPAQLDKISLESLVCVLLQYVASGLRLSLSAESTVLAHRLSSYYGVPVSQTPTLSSINYHPLPAGEIVHLFVPGSGRPDKGFLRIASIYRELSRALSTPFLLLAQDMPVYRYRQISSADVLPIDCPEVVLLPSSLSDDYLYSFMQSSHVVLLPYDRRVYEVRSSAIMADAACMGRPIVASGHCGFSGDIVRFSLGCLADSDVEFAQQVGSLIDSFRGRDRDRWLHSSARYRQFSVDSLLVFISVLAR